MSTSGCANVKVSLTDGRGALQCYRADGHLSNASASCRRLRYTLIGAEAYGRKPNFPLTTDC